MFCADLTRWLDVRTSFSYFLPFHALKIGVNFGRFGRLAPCFAGVEKPMDKDRAAVFKNATMFQEI